MCDRCLEPFMTRVDTTADHLCEDWEIRPGEIEDDVIMIHKDDHEIEVGQLCMSLLFLHCLIHGFILTMNREIQL